MAARNHQSYASAKLRGLITSRLTGIWLGEALFFDSTGKLEHQFETRTSLHAMGNLFYHQYDLSQSRGATRYCGVINGKIHADGLLEFRSSRLTGFGRLESDRLTLSWQTHKNNSRLLSLRPSLAMTSAYAFEKFHSGTGFRGWLESRESRFSRPPDLPWNNRRLVKVTSFQMRFKRLHKCKSSLRHLRVSLIK